MTNPDGPIPTTRWLDLVPPFLALLLIALAFHENRSVSADLEWPAFETQFREMAAAQTMLDEGYGPDTSYKGEVLWYNPLAPGLVAITSRLTGLPVRLVVPRAGAFLNLLAPLAFFLMVSLLVDRWTAFAATAGFLFVVGTQFPDYLAANYSPWLLPNHFVQGIFYVGLLACYWTRIAPASWGRRVLLGVILGLTFLGHTAPALILGCVIVGLAAVDGRGAGRLRQEAVRTAACLVTALLVSMPFLFFIGGHYHFRIVHVDPLISPFSRLDLDEVLFFARDFLSPVTVVALAGFLVYGAHARREPRAQVLIAWFLATVAFLTYNETRHLVRHLIGAEWPPLIPPFHFVFYLHACLAVGFGLTLREIAVAVRPRRGIPAGRTEPATAAALVVLTGLVVVWGWKPYLGRHHFAGQRSEALYLRSVLATDAFEWIRANTRNSDVFLSTNHMSLFVVNPAARKVVVTDTFFSNPYVSWEDRDRRRNELFDLLHRHDRQGFEALARTYDVHYVIWSDEVSVLGRGSLGMRIRPAVRTEDIVATGLRRVFTGRDVAIFQVG